MVAAQHRISSGSDFARALKHGARVSTRDLIVHVAQPGIVRTDQPGPRDDVATLGGPRLGLIVSKAVGNAVTRHRVARRLRAAFVDVMALIPADTLVVVRARPSAAGPSSVTLADQLSTALRHRRVRAVLDPAPVPEAVRT
ncbi:ribonuclease P protein component [Gordonia sp. (in: high G+C Gram-positive bacteria)]|jgi:ribonuclease P protein component|uniref:ribonuclease P protein component n=1 Tax=Gordonia sp. (in: high G+C Gram-positive bacteria) TaxID=84139 RepID=UPI001E0E4B12|nr:ribonuclease P protein component [Gordonia sp. (in: high G+C Gram-positive bacteria)]MCB1297129.1 ribonuclease P protein component [Gordonia sp. (in: high G+C Gram-positive bacteria)]HMS77621.1 ribonuclease P protein component [Gordonia sp. (in: high G+C Gram-positive bacteria)]HQV17084.1 ribonuclease P protein component [Gordonia sp. (in: high G+C Gram-positive bacteria)]